MKISLFFYIQIFFLACQQPYGHLKSGDLLFQDLNCGELCEAIESVTEGRNGQDFSHCAMVVEHEGERWVVEAIGEDVHLTSIDSFMARSYADHSKTIALRLPDSLHSRISGAQEFALKQLGKPYDDEFLLNNGKYYCSELLYDAFQYANQPLFELQPMTFHDPQTDSLMPAWDTYFKEIKKQVPQGKPGLNPGSISMTSFLKEIPLKK